MSVDRAGDVGLGGTSAPSAILMSVCINLLVLYLNIFRAFVTILIPCGCCGVDRCFFVLIFLGRRFFCYAFNNSWLRLIASPFCVD